MAPSFRCAHVLVYSILYRFLREPRWYDKMVTVMTGVACAGSYYYATRFSRARRHYIPTRSTINLLPFHNTIPRIWHLPAHARWRTFSNITLPTSTRPSSHDPT